jgi:hypothetical protein
MAARTSAKKKAFRPSKHFWSAAPKRALRPLDQPPPSEDVDIGGDSIIAKKRKRKSDAKKRL